MSLEIIRLELLLHHNVDDIDESDEEIEESDEEIQESDEEIEEKKKNI